MTVRTATRLRDNPSLSLAKWLASWVILTIIAAVVNGEADPSRSIKELMKKTSRNRIQEVFLKTYEPEYAVVLTYPEENVYKTEPVPEEEVGEFVVRAPVNHGIMVVVQYLQLRTQYRGPTRTDVVAYCRDYVQLSDGLGKSVQTCGLANKKDNSLEPSQLIGPRTFYSTSGQVTVKVFIDGNNGTDLTRYLENQFQLSFTATTDCEEAPLLPQSLTSVQNSSDGYQSEDSSDSASFVPCFNTSKSTGNVPPGLCISSSLFCDAVYHCGFDGLLSRMVGTDERYCGKYRDVVTYSQPRNPRSLLWIIAVIGVVAIIVMGVAYVSSSASSLTLPCMRKEDDFADVASSSTTQINKNAGPSTNGTFSSASQRSGFGSNYSNFTIEEPA